MKKTNKIVLLTGAGFSAIVGLKTLKFIVDSIQVPIDPSNETIKIISETWKIIHGQKGNQATLEDLLAKLQKYIEFSEMLSSDFIFRDILQPNPNQIYNGQFKRKWEDALSYCYRLMINNYGPKSVKTESKEFQFIIESLKLLASKNGGSLCVFTTNYDCLLNVLADKCNEINFFSNINNDDGRFGKDWFVLNKKNQNDKNPSVYLNRLHGCIGWFADSTSPYGVHEVYGTGNNLVIEDSKKLNQMAIKLISDEKIGLKPAFSFAFEQFNEKISNCEILLVWGHSFKDLEVLKSIINTTKSRGKNAYKIYYIDPYLENESTYRNIINTIKGETGIKKNFDINRINWEIQDGYAELLKILNKTFKGNIL